VIVAEPARVDLNCDVGESFGAWRLGDDAGVLDHVTSANVACGFHAGDPATMEATVRACKQRGVAVGAHPSYPDLAGFGRRSMRVEPGDVEAMVLYQIGGLETIARANGVRLTHVKPHGALYNDAANDRRLADAIVAAVRRAGNLRLYGLAGSVMCDAARAAGVAWAAEGFCDRAYEADGRLRSRTIEGAVVTDPAAAARQAVDIAARGSVRVDRVREIELRADTLCVHGDTPGAAGIARAVRAALENAGVRVAALE
jgi:UPF0271 protein